MKLPWKRKKPPDLVAEASRPKGHTHPETLKAGKLASLALVLVRSLIEAFGPRPAGSKASRLCAAKLKESLASFCDRTDYREFALQDTAHGFWIKLLVIVYPVALLLLWVGMPVAATILLSCFAYYVFRQFLVYRPIGEKRMPSSIGANVHGILEPEGEVLHTVVFGAHHDSARLIRYDKFDKKQYVAKVVVPFSLFALLLVSTVIQLLTELFSGNLLSVGLPPLPCLLLCILLTASYPLVLPLWSFFGEKVSPGAGDNLVAGAMGVELARYFRWKRECGKALSHTRLIFCSFDGEEVGLRGSRQWFSDNAELCENARFLNFDCLYHADALTFLDRDVNGFQPLSKTLAHRCVGIAKDMGYPAITRSIPFLFGGTDAAEAARCGLEACTLVGVSWEKAGQQGVYHSEADVPDAIEPKAIERSLSIAIKLVELIDAEALEDDTMIVSEEQEGDEAVPLLHFKGFTIR